MFTYDFGKVVEGLGMQEERTTGVSTYLLQVSGREKGGRERGRSKAKRIR